MEKMSGVLTSGALLLRSSGFDRKSRKSRAGWAELPEGNLLKHEPENLVNPHMDIPSKLGGIHYCFRV